MKTSIHRLPFRPLFLATTIALLSTTGCSDGLSDESTLKVQGAISYNGEPVTTGQIVFFPDSGGKIAVGQIQKDGTYILTTYKEGDGALPGSHQVAIISERDMEGIDAEDPEAEAEPSFIPTKYNMQKTSGLTAIVKEETNEIDFALTDK